MMNHDTDYLENTGDPSLKTADLTFSEAVAFIVGSNIGSGILGLAYTARFAGWPVLTVWLVIAGVFTTFSMLYLAEVCLRTKAPLQVPGLAEKYIGRISASLIYLALFINCMSCIIIYSNYSGSFLFTLFGIPQWIGSLLFTIPCVLVIWFGLKAVGMWEKFVSSGMILLLIILIAASLLSAKSDISRTLYTNWHYGIPLFSNAVFCYVAQYAVPELSRGMRRTPHKLPLAIIVGMVITGILLSAAPAAILSLTGSEQITQYVPYDWGYLLGQWAFYTAHLFALCAMMTSFWTVGESMVTATIDMFRLKDERNSYTRFFVLFCIMVPPFLLARTYLTDFIDAIGWAAIFGDIVLSIFPCFMLIRARKKGDQQPAWKCGWYAHPAVMILLILTYCLVCGYCVFSLFGLLPVH